MILRQSVSMGWRGMPRTAECGRRGTCLSIIFSEAGGAARTFRGRRRSLSCMPSCFWNLGERRSGGIDGDGGFPFLRARIRDGKGFEVGNGDEAGSWPWRDDGMAMRPMGPAPEMRTSSPRTGEGECGVDRVPKGSEDGGDFFRDAGVVDARCWSWESDCISAKAPGRLTPTPEWQAQRWRRAGRGSCGSRSAGDRGLRRKTRSAGRWKSETLGRRPAGGLCRRIHGR